MMNFVDGQKWITADGRLHGEVAKISNDGRSGVLVITDEQGNAIGKHSYTAAELQNPDRFVIGQKWITTDRKLHGEVVKIFDDGRSGVLVITDDQRGTSGVLIITDQGNTPSVDTVNAEEFRGLGQWGVADRNDTLSHLATELQRRYVGYMQQKEYMAYLGFAFYLTAASAILLNEKWPPPNWGSHNRTLAIAAIVGLWALVLCYLRFELRRRRWAAMRLAGCEHVLVRLATATHPANWAAASPPTMEIARWRRILGCVWPLNNTVVAIGRSNTANKQAAPEATKYPNIFVEEWVNQERRGTDAIRHERLIIPTVWIVLLLLVVHTLLAQVTPMLADDTATRMQKWQETTTVTIHDLEDRVAEFTAAHAALKTALSGQLTALEGNLSAQRGAVLSIEARFSQLEDRVRAISIQPKPGSYDPGKPKEGNPKRSPRP
jgi:hypothetical protein